MEILEHVKELEQRKESTSYIIGFLSGHFSAVAELTPDKTYTADELSTLFNMLCDISTRHIYIEIKKIPIAERQLRGDQTKKVCTSILEEKEEKIKMVNVTVEYEEQKTEFTGEFFMGFTFSHIGNIGNALAFKAGSTAIGQTDKRCLPKNTALCIADVFKRTYADSKEYAAALLDASDVLAARAKEVVASKLDKPVTVVQVATKGEDDGGKH